MSSSPGGTSAWAWSCCSWVIISWSSIRSSTRSFRASAAWRFWIGSYAAGEAMMPARNAAWAGVAVAAALWSRSTGSPVTGSTVMSSPSSSRMSFSSPKYVRMADSIPYAPLPKYTEFRYWVRIFCFDHFRSRW